MIQQHGDSTGDTLWLVSARGIAVGLILLAVAVWNQSAPLAAIVALLLALSLVTRVWSLLALRSVRCTLTFRDDRAFPDDEIDLILRVQGRGPIPIPWLEVDFVVPRGLYATPEPGIGVLSGDGRALHMLVTLMPLRIVERTIRVRCRQRGLYKVESVSLLVADPLRLYPRRREEGTDARLLVFPRIVPLEQIGLRAGLAIGDLRGPLVVLPDPSRSIGVRDYRPGDSPRQIHWKASARRGSIQVKVLERTVRRDLALYLDVGGFDHSWLVYREALFERAVTAAASLANAAVERGGSVALACGGADPSFLPGNTGLDQLREILEALAVVAPSEGRPIESMLAATLGRHSAGTTIVVLTPTPGELLLAELEPKRRRGDPVAIVYCGLRPTEPPEGIAWFDLGRERDVITALAEERPGMTTSLLVMELAIVSLLLGWVWVVIANSPWPAPWAVLLAGPFALVGGKWVPYGWRRLTWFDGAWWAIVAVVVALLAEIGNSFWPGVSTGTRWNVQFVAGLLVAWRAWALAEGWIDRELVESEMQIGTLVVLGILLMLIWIAPGAGLVPAIVFIAAGLFGLGLARRTERRDPRASLESDWLVLVAGLVILIVVVAFVTVAVVTPDLLLAIYEQAQMAFFAALGAIGALFHWLGSFFFGPDVPMQPQQGMPSPGQLPPTEPVTPDATLAVPPSWIFELLLTFTGVVFLFFAGRAVYRLMKMNVRSLRLRLPRQREPALAISTADTFTWHGWWRQVFAWLRAWLSGSASSTGEAARGQQGTGAAVAEQRSIRALYREFLGQVARAGFERQPSTTPNELAREVNAARPGAAPAISTATELYVRTRYGEEPVGRDELSRMRTAVQQARRQLTPPASSADESTGRPTAR